MLRITSIRLYFFSHSDVPCIHGLLAVDYSPSLVDYSASRSRTIELFIQAAVGASVAHRVSVKMMVLGHRGVERVGSNGFWPL